MQERQALAQHLMPLSRHPPRGLLQTCLMRAALVGIGAAVSKKDGGATADVGTSKVKRAQVPRKNAVLVFGATGRTGQLIVKTLLASGRTVIAACRTAKAAREAWAALGVIEGEQENGKGILFTETGVDITQPRSLKPSVFAGATQVLSCCPSVA